MKSAEQRVAEIRTPPSLANWVRLNSRRRDDTAKKIVRFVLGKPRHALLQIYKLFADYVTLGIPPENVRSGIDYNPNPLVRKLGHEIATALLPWLDENDVKGVAAFHQMSAAFPIGRGIVVPVKPTFVFVKDGKLTPVFLIGWSSIPFDDYQKRLFGAIVQRAILSQEDFEGSDALILFVPRYKFSKSERYVHPIWVNDLTPVDEEDLRKQFDCFGNALDDAVPVIFSELARRGE